MTKGDKNLFTIVLCGLIIYFLLYPRVFRVLSTSIVGRILLVSLVIVTTNVHLYLGLGLLLVIFYLYKDVMMEGFESTNVVHKKEEKPIAGTIASKTISDLIHIQTVVSPKPSSSNLP
jgi:uncharacterized protein with PQ loop repeat